MAGAMAMAKILSNIYFNQDEIQSSVVRVEQHPHNASTFEEELL